MFRIFGNITVKETREAIPDLVVAAFDIDPAQFSLDQPGGVGSEGAWTDRTGSDRYSRIPTAVLN